MLKETGIVVAYNAGIAMIKCQSKSACGACGAKSACGNAALSELAGEKLAKGEHLLRVQSLTPLKIGQYVEVGLSEKSLLISTLLFYAVPLLTILISTLLGQMYFQQELVSLIFIVISTAFSFLFVRFYVKKLQTKPQYQPILLKAF